MSKKRPRTTPASDTPTKHEISALEPKVLRPMAEHLAKKWDDSSIQFARNLQGGWEVWLQVELASVLLQQLSYQVKEGDNGYVVVREYDCWNSSNGGKGKGKCDIWIEPSPGPDHPILTDNSAIVIELKVEYAYLKIDDHDKRNLNGTIIRNINYVRGRFEEDMAKMASGLTPDARKRIQGCGIRKLCVGVTSRPEDLKGWKEIQEKYGTQVNYVHLREQRRANNDLDPQGGLFMLWWEDSSEERKNKQSKL